MFLDSSPKSVVDRFLSFACYPQLPSYILTSFGFAFEFQSIALFESLDRSFDLSFVPIPNTSKRNELTY